MRPKPRQCVYVTEKFTTFVKPKPKLITAAEEEKTTGNQHWKGNTTERPRCIELP